MTNKMWHWAQFIIPGTLIIMELIIFHSGPSKVAAQKTVQVEQSPVPVRQLPKDECDWMYVKAREFALSGTHDNASVVWSNMYIACMKRNDY